MGEKRNLTMLDLALPVTNRLEEEGEVYILATTLVPAAKIMYDIPQHFSGRGRGRSLDHPRRTHAQEQSTY